jgi:alcohol dehydrogenase class IV
MDLTYRMPTQVIFGKACVEKHGFIFRHHGKNALIVTGKTSALISGALEDVCAALSKGSVSWSIYDEIQPNPSIENVRDASEKARSEKADFIIGIGGGSPMDAAKAVAVLAVNDLDDDALFNGPYERTPLPVIAVPTTAGTGSEVTPYSILTDMNNKTKKNLFHESLFPKAAFLDATYTEKLPFEVTVNTAMDAFSHSVESILSRKSNAMSAMIALESLRMLGPALGLLDDTLEIDFQTREKLLLGSMLGGMAIAQTGTTVVHAMGYSLTFFKNIDHGRANGLLLCEYLNYVYSHNLKKMTDILEAMGMKSLEELQVLIKKQIKPLLTLTDEEISLYTEKVLMAKSVEYTVPKPTASDIRMIYRKSLGKL